ISDMTSLENLRLGAFTRSDNEVGADIEMVYNYFPRLKERTGLAGYLSGGEQQMLAIGRALMARPKMILMDEPSMGLSPLLVKEVFAIIQKINRDLGVTILLVEQNARAALTVASHGYIMEQGKVVLDGTADELRDNEDVKEFYLGGAGARCRLLSFPKITSAHIDDVVRTRREWRRCAQTAGLLGTMEHLSGAPSECVPGCSRRHTKRGPAANVVAFASGLRRAPAHRYQRPGRGEPQSRLPRGAGREAGLQYHPGKV